MYTVYSLKHHSWCVFKDNGTLVAELVKSGFLTQEAAKQYIRSLK